MIRIRTDEGIEGIGEVDSSPEVARAVITAPRSHSLTGGLRDLLIGEDPLEIERLWEKMYRGAIFLGRRGVAIHALSGIDIALWDIKGKVLGQPVSELIGAPQRDRVRAYASMLMPDTPAEVREVVAEMRERGFTAVKLGWGPLGQSPANDIALAAAACEAAGDDVAIMIDAGFAYGADPALAIPVARELESLGVYWLEEPFQPDELDAYAALADAVELRIAAGEQDATLWSFRDLIERGRIDVVQPDVTRCGGITEILRIIEARRGGRRAAGPARVEERDHQGGLAPRERGHRRQRGLPGVLRARDGDQPRPHPRGVPAGRRRLRGGADRARPRRHA